MNAIRIKILFIIQKIYKFMKLKREREQFNTWKRFSDFNNLNNINLLQEHIKLEENLSESEWKSVYFSTIF